MQCNWPHGKENRISCKLPEQISLNSWSSKSYIYITYQAKLDLPCLLFKRSHRIFLYLLKNRAVGHKLELIPWVWFLEHEERGKRKLQRSKARKWEGTLSGSGESFISDRSSSAYFTDWHMAYGIWLMLQMDRQWYMYSCKVLAFLVLAHTASWPAESRFAGWFDFPQLLYKAWGQGRWGEGGDVGEERVIADWSLLTAQRLASTLTATKFQAATFSMCKPFTEKLR